MTANKKNQEFKIRKTRTRILNIVSEVLTDILILSLVFLAAGIVLWIVMHVIFDVCIDSWMADPELLNFQYMWNVLMNVIPFTLWALASGFLVTVFLASMCELLFGNIMIFLLKRRMRRENTLREGSNNASH